VCGGRGARAWRAPRASPSYEREPRERELDPLERERLDEPPDREPPEREPPDREPPREEPLFDELLFDDVLRDRLDEPPERDVDRPPREDELELARRRELVRRRPVRRSAAGISS
jgi:hypothetical protein